MQNQNHPQHAQDGRPEHVEVLVIGAGQAGLAVGWHLREQGPFALVVAAAMLSGLANTLLLVLSSTS